MPKIITTQTPPNESLNLEFQSQFHEIVNLELNKTCYIGPFSCQVMESLIGPFQSSPFLLCPNQENPDIFVFYKIILSSHMISPIHCNLSINSFLDSDDFPTTWETFSVISLLIHHQLPPLSQVATQDIAKAYRTILLHHSQWWGTIVRIGEDEFVLTPQPLLAFPHQQMWMVTLLRPF